MPIIFILTKHPPRFLCFWVYLLKKHSLTIIIIDKLAQTMQMGTLSLLGVGVKKEKWILFIFKLNALLQAILSHATLWMAIIMVEYFYVWSKYAWLICHSSMAINLKTYTPAKWGWNKISGVWNLSFESVNHPSPAASYDAFVSFDSSAS